MKKVSKILCPNCGGSNVESLIWIDPTTGKIDCCVLDYIYCNDCEDHYYDISDKINPIKKVKGITDLPKIVCSNCGGSNIVIGAYTNLNTYKFIDYDIENWGSNFCVDCDIFGPFETEEEYLKRQQE